MKPKKPSRTPAQKKSAPRKSDPKAAKPAAPKKTAFRDSNRKTLPQVKVKAEMDRELFAIWREYIAIDEWTPADRWISDRIRRNEFSRLERLWISGMFLSALRFGSFALACEELLGKTAAGTVKTKLRGIAPESLFFWIEQRLLFDRQISGTSRYRHENPKARTASKQITESKSPTDELVCAGLPAWIAPQITSRTSVSAWTLSDRNRFIRRHSSTGPLWIRISRENRKKESLEDLSKNGFELIQRSERCFAVQGEKNIFSTESYKKGNIEVQDFASQQIGEQLISRADKAVHIWDCCAGNGGKSVQIASALERVTLRVSDIADHKLVRIHERAVSAGVTDRIAYVKWDGTKLPEFHRSITEQGGFDAVLVDAPCSGSGTWRKNPDGRLFFTKQRLDEITAVQKKLLALVSKAVRPGGLLIYGTCSFFTEENEQQVHSFLHDHREFSLEEMNLHGNPREDSDTTFSAVFRRS